MRIVGKYTQEQVVRMGVALALLVQIFETEPFDDVLGKLYMEFALGNPDSGQFFTPYSLCKLMAQMQMSGIGEKVAEKGFITVNEPACGAGAMIIALAECMKEQEFNPQTQLHVIAQDIDIRAVHMAYIQFSLLGIPAVVYHGDTLSMKTWSAWRTPFHVLNGWEWRLKGELSPAEVVGGLTEMLTSPVNPFAAPEYEQITLFEEMH